MRPRIADRYGNRYSPQYRPGEYHNLRGFDVAIVLRRHLGATLPDGERLPLFADGLRMNRGMAPHRRRC